MDNAVNVIQDGQVSIVVKQFVILIANMVPVCYQMYAYVNLDGKVFFVTLVFAPYASLGFVKHQKLVIVSTDMKELAAIFQSVSLLAITVSLIYLMFVLVMRVGKAEFVISQFVMLIVVHRGIV